MISVRMVAVIFLGIFVLGCAQTNEEYLGNSHSQVPVAKTDCPPTHRWGSDLREYSVLIAQAKLALNYLIPYWKIVHFKDSAEGRAAEKRERAKADEVIKKLDDLERQTEAMKASAGNCFGEGDDGKKVAESYSLTKDTIADQKKAVADGLEEMVARSKAIEEERSNFERWRAENRESLIHHVGGMKLEIVRIAKRDIFGNPASRTVITVEATNTTTSRILKPRNQRFVGDVRFSIGASLTDSFGNDYKLTSISPNFLGSEAGGIRPGQTVTFELRFGDVPLQNAESVRLSIEPGTLGQEGGTMFELPSEAFYGAIVKRWHFSATHSISQPTTCLLTVLTPTKVTRRRLLNGS